MTILLFNNGIKPLKNLQKVRHFKLRHYGCNSHNGMFSITWSYPILIGVLLTHNSIYGFCFFFLLFFFFLVASIVQLLWNMYPGEFLKIVRRVHLYHNITYTIEKPIMVLRRRRRRSSTNKRKSIVHIIVIFFLLVCLIHFLCVGKIFSCV